MLWWQGGAGEGSKERKRASEQRPERSLGENISDGADSKGKALEGGIERTLGNGEKVLDDGTGGHIDPVRPQ